MKYRVEYWNTDGSLTEINENDYANSLIRLFDLKSDVKTFLSELDESKTYAALRLLDDGSYIDILVSGE